MLLLDKCPATWQITLSAFEFKRPQGIWESAGNIYWKRRFVSAAAVSNRRSLENSRFPEIFAQAGPV